ncbi:MAG: hypothetical protein AAB403_01770 [Planctomycetota bacterium]
MAWAITGNSNDVLIGVTKHGNALVRGKASHTPCTTENSVDSESTAITQALRLLQTVQADWRIMSTDAVRHEIGDIRANLLRMIETRLNASIAAISCIGRNSNNEPALSFIIALQPQAFQQVRQLFAQLVAGPSGIRYTISVGFSTFRFPGESADTPTLDEFLSGRPYFSDEVSVSIGRARDDGT